MTFSHLRANLEAWWTDTDAREVGSKDSQGALLAFMDLYEDLDSDEREVAEQMILEWIESENERKRFDALAMVDHFGIRAAIPRLRKAETELVARKDHEAPYELAKIRRILQRLED